MKPKFLKSTRSNLRVAAERMLIIALALAAYLPTALLAQTPATLAPGTNVKTPHAYIRFWNMLPAKVENSLVLFSGEQNSLAAFAPNNVYGSYLPAPVGSYLLVVKRAIEGAPALQRLPVVLPENSFITLLATEKNGQPTIEMFNDTPDPKIVEAGARIVVRQFFPKARITVSVNGGPSSKALDYGETTVLDNIAPSGQVAINLQAVLPATTPSVKIITLSGDFSVLRHATLLLLTDNYGRFRPRLSMDAVLPQVQ